MPVMALPAMVPAEVMFGAVSIPVKLVVPLTTRLPLSVSFPVSVRVGIVTVPVKVGLLMGAFVAMVVFSEEVFDP